MDDDPTERALDQLFQAGHSLSSDGPLPFGSWTPLLGGGGGGPGLDGCNYTTGSGCRCHHLNGGPCLFDVVADPEENNNLAQNGSFAEIYQNLLTRFREISSTGYDAFA